MYLLSAPWKLLSVHAYKCRGQIISFKVMQRFHYFENDGIQWRRILIRWIGQVKRIVLFMIRSWLFYQKRPQVFTQHSLLFCIGSNQAPALWASQPSHFFHFQAWKTKPQSETWTFCLVTQDISQSHTSWCEVTDLLGPVGSSTVK